MVDLEKLKTEIEGLDLPDRLRLAADLLDAAEVEERDKKRAVRGTAQSIAHTVYLELKHWHEFES